MMERWGLAIPARDAHYKNRFRYNRKDFFLLINLQNKDNVQLTMKLVQVLAVQVNVVNSDLDTLGWSDLDLFFLASLRDRIKIDPDPESDSK
jgi:hypothetical protein